MKLNILKRTTTMLIMLLTVLLIMPQNISALDSSNDSDIPEELVGIDFSKELTEDEIDQISSYYAKDAQEVFNESYAESLVKKDQAQIDSSLSSRSKSTLYVKETQESTNDTLSSKAAKSLGSYGDILVTYSFSSFGINVAAVGHAAIVHTTSNYTIESFPEGDGHANGVRRYANDWGDRARVYGVRVKNATLTDYRNAANYAISQANLKKHYNWNFFNKGTTDTFYCSQLVWRAWKNQGFEVDRMNLGNWEPVSPAELIGGSGTYVFYQN